MGLFLVSNILEFASSLSDFFFGGGGGWVGERGKVLGGLLYASILTSPPVEIWWPLLLLTMPFPEYDVVQKHGYM